MPQPRVPPVLTLPLPVDVSRGPEAPRFGDTQTQTGRPCQTGYSLNGSGGRVTACVDVTAVFGVRGRGCIHGGRDLACRPSAVCRSRYFASDLGVFIPFFSGLCPSSYTSWQVRIDCPVLFSYLSYNLTHTLSVATSLVPFWSFVSPGLCRSTCLYFLSLYSLLSFSLSLPLSLSLFAVSFYFFAPSLLSFRLSEEDAGTEYGTAGSDHHTTSSGNDRSFHSHQKEESKTQTKAVKTRKEDRRTGPLCLQHKPLRKRK